VHASIAVPRPASGRLGPGRRVRAKIALRPMRRALIAALVLGGALVLPSSALALTLTWSGLTTATAVGSGSANWSNPSNWVNWAGTPTAVNGSTLSFPVLSNSACTGSPPTGACYTSTNDLGGLNVSAISIDDGVPYWIGGNPITLAGGITAGPSASDTGQGSPDLRVPISLAAPQTWSITGGPDNQQLGLAAPVTGSTDALAISLSNQTVLGLYADDEVGPVNVTSSGAPSTVELGFPSNPGSLNGTDGKPVSFSGGAGLVADPGTLGPLAMTGGQVQVGGPYQAGTLAVNGAVTLDSTSTLSTSIPRSGTRPGNDFSQLSATGTVNLGNAQLSLGGQTFVGEAPSCPVLTPGDVDTLMTTTGSLTGTFAGVPDGTTIPIHCPGNIRTPPTVEINYTAHSVTATVETSDGVATATTLSPPASAVTNQVVTLTTSVSASFGTPDGTVEFDNNGTAIAGCSSRPLALNGAATCQTAFTAASPEALTAVFEPADGSSFQDSRSAAADLTVGKDSTTTTLAVSSPTPAVGAGVTYTATVTPADAGAAEPSASVELLDGGTPIGPCASQPLTAGQSPSVATCTLSYPAAGSHKITATYLGDGSFAVSTSSPPQTVTVQPTSAPTPPSNVSKPTIAGTPIQGQTLTESQGSWTSSPTSYAHRWEDCDSSGGGCSPIAGATARTYTLTSNDVGHTIRVQETASNVDGTSAAATSDATAIVRRPAPVRPAVTVAHVNCTLTPRSNKVLLRGKKGKPGKQPNARPGMMALVATCDQAANVTMKGYVTESLGKEPKRGKQRRKVFKLTIARASLTARDAKVLLMKLPVNALLALQHRSKESATFTLIATNANGTTSVIARIGTLRH
jgi:hypothetical protein